MATVMVAAANGVSAAPDTAYDDYQTLPELQYNDRNIAVCDDTGGGRSVLYPTPFADQFWSRMACGEWRGALKLLDATPKSSPERGIPSVYSAKTAWSKCYWDSFAYGPDYHEYRTDKRRDGSYAVDETKICHGIYTIETVNFEKLQRAVTYTCDAKLAL